MGKVVCRQGSKIPSKANTDDECEVCGHGGSVALPQSGSHRRCRMKENPERNMTRKVMIKDMPSGLPTVLARVPF